MRSKSALIVRGICLLFLASASPCRAAPSNPQIAVQTAIDSAAATICAHPTPSAAVQSRINLLRTRLEMLGEPPVPALSAAALLSAVPSQRLAHDCRNAIAQVLRTKLVTPHQPPIYTQPQPHPIRHEAHRAPPELETAQPPPPPPPPVQALPPPPPPPVVTAPAPPPAPAPNPEAAAIAALDTIISNLPRGQVALNAPASAKVGEPQPAEALLSLTKTEAQLKAALPTTGQTTTASLGVAARMSATLDGGAAFDVTPAGPQDHLISGQQDTEWDWTVTPKAAGQQTLKLTVDAVLTVNGQTSTVRIDTLQKTVNVTVTAMGQLERFKRMFEDVSWLWSLPPIAAALAWLWSRLRGGKKPDQTS